MPAEAPWGSFIDFWVGNLLTSETSVPTPDHFFDAPRYTRSVTRSTQRLETLLKVIIAPQVRCHFKCMFDIDLRPYVYTQDPAEGFILNYTLLIGDASFSNFQKVCVETQVHLSQPLTHYDLLRTIYPSIDN